MELTAEEKQIIESKRAADALHERRKAFYRELLILAAMWIEWQAESGMGLTYSTFINDFDYHDKVQGDFDHKQMYDALMIVLNTAAEKAENYRG